MDLERQKRNAKQDERNQQLEILSKEIKDLIEKRQPLLEACENLDQELNTIREAEKKNDMRLVIKGNGLKRKSEEKRKEAVKL